MIRLLFTALLCVLASSQATAQNWVSRTLLGLDVDQRNETFTYLLRDSNAKCDQVIRTLFNGSTVELDLFNRGRPVLFEVGSEREEESLLGTSNNSWFWRFCLS